MVGSPDRPAHGRLVMSCYETLDGQGQHREATAALIQLMGGVCRCPSCASSARRTKVNRWSRISTSPQGAVRRNRELGHAAALKCIDDEDDQRCEADVPHTTRP